MIKIIIFIICDAIIDKNFKDKFAPAPVSTAPVSTAPVAPNESKSYNF